MIKKIKQNIQKNIPFNKIFYRIALMYIPCGKSTSNIYMTLTIYMTCNSFICTILFGLLESSKLVLFKDRVRKIIEADSRKISSFFDLFRDFKLNYLQNKTFK